MRLRSAVVVWGLLLACPAWAAPRTQVHSAQLAELMRSSPAAAVAAAPDLADSYTGPVEVLVSDDFDHGSSITLYRFRSGDLDVTAYQESAGVPSLRCGDIVQLDGVRFGAEMAVSRARVVSRASGRAAAGAGCSATGEQKTAVILATFPGSTALGTTVPAVEQLMFDARAFSTNVWYREMSYGKAAFSGKAFGPYMLDRAYSCSETAQMRAAAIRAADADVDFTQYQRVVLVFPRIANCTFGGMSTLGCTDLQTGDGPVRASWVWANSSSSLLSLVIHELGHSLGVGHSRQLRFPGSSLEADDFRAVPVEYGDRTAAMGSGTYGDFAAAHKLEFGWLEDGADVVTVESDGDFVLAPLGSANGVRALRVRRRAAVGGDEWLWIEHRRVQEAIAGYLQSGTGSGFGGALIRRETPASGTSTHLLDLSPASLDQARIDLGAVSETWPDLPSESSWADPHSGLSITTGRFQAEGLPVAIRYAAPCAEPALREVSVPPEGGEVLLPVAAAEDCGWQAASGRTWLAVVRDAGNVRIQAEPLPDLLPRSGWITAGRNVVRVTQKAAPRATELLSAYPPSPELPAGGSLPVIFHLRDENGLDDMRTLFLNLTPAEDSGLSPCRFRYNAVSRVLEASADGVEFVPGTSPGAAVSGPCAVEASVIRINSETEIIFRVILRFDGPEGTRLSVSLSAAGADGEPGPGLPAPELNVAAACRALPAYDYGIFLSAASSGVSLPLQVSPAPCAWTATSDSAWLRILDASGSEAGSVRFDMAANPLPATREGRIFVNGSPVRIVQYGNGELQPYYVTLRPTETVVSALAGRAVLAFSYGLGDTVPAGSDFPWLRIVSVERNADRREVTFSFDANPDAAPRLGSLWVGGRTFTVLQEGRPDQ